MNETKTDKAILVKSVARMVTDKEMVRSYLKGKVSIEKLKENGIKLAKPL